MNLIIFDFDGTIADSLAIFVEATNRLADDFSYQPLSASKLPHLRNLSLREMISQLGLAKWQFPFFIRRFRIELSDLMADVQLVDGMKQVLLNIHQERNRLGIITSNSRHNVETFLDSQGLQHLFEFIHGGQVLSGKTRVLEKLLKRNRSASQSLVYIGDEVSDVKAAKYVGLPNIAVGWGFNSQAVLSACHPDILIDDPGQLVGAISQICNI